MALRGALGRLGHRWRRGILRGRRGTWWHPPSLCVAGVARLDGLVAGDAAALWWQAWHLWHWAGSGVTHHLCHTPSFTHHFVTRHLSHTLFHTQLCHTPSLTHHLSHTTLSSIICDTPSFTQNFVTHHPWPSTLSHTTLSPPSLTHHLSHTTLSHTIFDPQLCHTPSFTHRFVTPSFTHHFVTHHLSHNFVTHHLSHTIFDIPSFTHHRCPTPFLTHLCHTPLCHTIFHTPLCHTPSLTHHLSHHFVTHHFLHPTFSHTIFHHFAHTTLSHTIFHLSHTTLSHTNFVTRSLSHTTFTHHLSHTPLSHTIVLTFRSFTISFVFPSCPAPLQHLVLIIGRSCLVGLSGPLIPWCHAMVNFAPCAGGQAEDCETSCGFDVPPLQDQEGVSPKDHTEAVRHRKPADPDSEESCSLRLKLHESWHVMTHDCLWGALWSQYWIWILVDLIYMFGVPSDYLVSLYLSVVGYVVWKDPNKSFRALRFSCVLFHTPKKTRS